MFLGSGGSIELTNHQFYRLYCLKMIEQCPGCTAQMDDENIYYHLHSQLHGEMNRLEHVLVDILEEELH